MNNTLSQFIKVFPNALTPDDCLQLIAHFEASDTHWGHVIDNAGLFSIDLDLKKAKQLRIKQDDHPELDDILFNSTGKILTDYVGAVNDFYPPAGTDDGYQILKYDAGEGFYGWHNDTNTASICNRTLAVIWFLNTVADGGEVEFSWGKKVKAKAGSALIFPCNWLYPYRANIPNKMAKYIATTWIGF